MTKGIKIRFLSVMLATAITAGSISGNGSLFPVSAEAVAKTVVNLQNPTVNNGMTTWDCIWFGNYYQSDISGKLKDPIKWRVLSVNGNDAFLLADKALEQMPYCQGTVTNPEPDKWGNIETEIKTDTLNWENCTLRSFLNGYDGKQNVTELDYTEDNFLDTAFTKKEQEGILTTTVTADANPDKNSPQGKDTEDKIYLLSVKEVKDKNYGFASDEARRYYNTPNYTFTGGRSGKKGKIGVGQHLGYSWWTRTSGQEYSGRYVYPVASGLYGGIETQGAYADSPGFGVRPVMHVDLSKVEGLWEYAGTVNSDGSMAEENAKELAVPGTVEDGKTSEPDATKAPDVTKTPEPTEEATQKPDATNEATKAPNVTGTPEPNKNATPKPVETATPVPQESVKPSMAPTEKPQSTPYSNNDTLPILNIEIDESKGTIADMNNDNEHNTKCYGSMSFAIPKGYTSQYGTNGIKSNETLELDYIKGRGNASWHAGDKKPYKIKLKAKADLFGMGANKHWVLINPTNADSTFMKNKLLYDWAAKIGSNYAPQSVFVDVVMNGEYVGHYLLCEHIRVGKTRVDIDDIDEAKPEDTDTLTGGYLINSDEYAAMSENYFTTTKSKACYEIISPSLENTTVERKQYIINYIERLEEAIASDTFINAQGERYSDLMDVDSFVNYFLVQLLSNNMDAFHNSTYLYKERGGKLYWGPVWDFDHSMEGIDNATSNSVVNGSSRKFVKDLLRDPEVARKVQERYIEVRESLVELYQNGGTVDQYANQIRISASHDLDKWCGSYVYYFDEEIEDLKEWIAARIQFMDSYIPTLIGEHYTVTLDYANGEKISEAYVGYGLTMEIPKAEAENYKFLGWYYQENGVEKQFTKDTKVEKDMSLTAKWERKKGKKYQFTLDAQGGTLKGSRTYKGKKTYAIKVDKDTEITLNSTAVRSGYHFDGWFFDKEGKLKMTQGGVMCLDEDTTLYAHWTKITVGIPKIVVLEKSGNRMKVKVSKVSGAKGYEVFYGKKRKLTRATKKTITGGSYTTEKLKKGTYYVKIRAYKMDSTGKKRYSRYTKTKRIAIK